MPIEPITFTITVLGFKKLTGWVAIKFLMALYLKKITAAMAAAGISAHGVTTTSLSALLKARFIDGKNKSEMIKIAIEEGLTEAAAEFIVNFIINLRLG
jgi:hypothetical protein